MQKSFGTLRVVLLSHYATTAMQDFLTIYLQGKSVEYLAVVNFPLPEIPRLRAVEIAEYVRGDRRSFRAMKTVVKPASIAYTIHFFQCLYLLFRLPPTDIVIAQNSLLGLAALFARAMGRVKKVVFYSHGLTTNRFGGSVINNLYQKLDAFVYAHATTNWVLSDTISHVRKLQKEKQVRVVPASVPPRFFPDVPLKKNPTLVFIGVLNTMNGADLLPHIAENLIRQGEDIRLDIIGIGPLESEIKTYIRTHNLGNHIRMLGYRELKQYAPSFSSYFCGLAPYRPDSHTLLGSTDPMKLQIYTASGIPSLTTEGFSFSKRISEYSLGYAIPFGTDSFADAVIRLLHSAKQYRIMRKSCKAYATDHDIFRVYDRVFQEIL